MNSETRNSLLASWASTPSPKRLVKNAILTGAVLFAMTGAAHAGGGGSSLPWEGPLQTVMDSITGPVAALGATLAFVVAGFIMWIGGIGDGAKRFLAAIIGVAVIVGAANLVQTLFGVSGGAVL